MRAQKRIMIRQGAQLALVTLILLLLFVLVGFTAGSSSPRVGTYGMSVVAEDIPANVPVEARSTFIGKWQMTFAKENGYKIAKDGKVLVEGHFTVAGGQIKLKDERGDLACTQAPEMETGTYEVSDQDNKLTFTLVTDKCPGRNLVLTLHSWLRELQDHANAAQGPPPLKPTPPEDTARYVAWMERQGKPITDRPHEDVAMRFGDWGFFYHGDRPVGSFSAPLGRTALDRSGHAVTEKENSDWYALLSTNGLNATQALKSVAWLFNADGLLPGDLGPSSRNKISAPSLNIKDGTVTFQGSCEAHTDPPYEMRITIVAAATGVKIVVADAIRR
jgi:hypothetical protein